MKKAARILAVVYVLAILLLTYNVVTQTMYLQEQIDSQEAFEASCEAESGQVQPHGKCVRVLKNVETGAYHIRPATTSR